MNDRSDRRRARRRRKFDEHGIVRARVRPGYEVEMVDVSAGGALVESAHRLLPGSLIELHLASAARDTSMRGRVVRCAVARLGAAGIRYHGAITFDRELSWFHDHDTTGYFVPVDETRASLCDGGDATRTEQ